MTDKPKMGRPTKFNDELADRICELVAINPVGLPKLCSMYPELPTAETIKQWRWTKPDFSSKYNKAKEFQAEIMAESMEDVCDELEVHVYTDDNGVTRLDTGMVVKARLVVDTRKWTASKLAPKIYGDAKRVEELEQDNARVKEELRALRDKLDKANVSEY